MINRILFCAVLYLISLAVYATPSVSGNTISWPDDGWYQVQNTSDYTTVCNGGSSCVVEPGTYKVINHTTGEKFRGIEVSGSDTGGSHDGVSVSGNVISWPDDGWYEVQNTITYMTVCSGGTSCVVAPGTYKVINHSTGEKFRGIEVSESSSGGSPSGVSVSGNVISWPDDGWYQVQDSRTYTTVCTGGTSCLVEPGTYKVINHTTGEKFRGIEVSGSTGQGSARVTFDINVPAYQSNKLQVHVIWGDSDITAQWIGDEMWSASADFPTNTENLLSVIFYDLNGDIEIGSYEKIFRTDSSSAESVLINADQFDTDRWDRDGDGVSNLDELMGHTDPFVDESTLLEVFESVSIHLGLTVSADFESRLSEERPFTESIKDLLPVPENGPVSGYERNVDINIDTSGNGTFDDFYQQAVNQGSYYRLYELAGTRINSGDSIKWDGSRVYKDDALNGTTTSINFSSEVSIIDERKRSFVESISSYESEFYFYSTIIDSNLVGSVIDSSALCRPVSGSVQITYSTNRTGSLVTETTLISKEVEDAYWRVSEVTNDDEANKNEYLVRTLKSKPFELGDFENSEADFICNFVDW